MPKHSEQPITNSELPWLNQRVIDPDCLARQVERAEGMLDIAEDAPQHWAGTVEDQWERNAHQSSEQKEEKAG